MREKGFSVVIYIITLFAISSIIVGGSFYLKNKGFLINKSTNLKSVSIKSNKSETGDSIKKPATVISIIPEYNKVYSSGYYEQVDLGFSFDIPEGFTASETIGNVKARSPWLITLSKKFDDGTTFPIRVHVYKDLSINDIELQKLQEVIYPGKQITFNHSIISGHQTTEIIYNNSYDMPDIFTYIENNRLTIVVYIPGQAGEKSKYGDKYDSNVAAFRQFLKSIKISDIDQEKLLSAHCFDYWDPQKNYAPSTYCPK